jgi:CRISPR-associated protein Cas1
MVNRRQLTERDFERQPGGATFLTDGGRIKVLTAWDAHMDRSIRHRALESQIARRQIPHLQAMLLARHLRGDLAHYLPHRSTPR